MMIAGADSPGLPVDDEFEKLRLSDTMKLKEDIYQAIQTLNSEELVLLYELIRWLEQLRKTPDKPGTAIPIEKIHELTGSSKSNWAKLIIEERAERV